MVRLLPAGRPGFMCAGPPVAFMSAVASHIDLGSNDRVNDVYRVFLRPAAPEREWAVGGLLARGGAARSTVE